MAFIFDSTTGTRIGLLHMSQGDVVGASSSQVAERIERESTMQGMLDDLVQLDADEVEALLTAGDSEKSLLDELDEIQLDNTPKSIRIQEDWALRKFNEVLNSKKYSCNLETAETTQLVTGLRVFYAFMRKLDGGFYAPASLVTARAGLFRFLLRTRGLNIIEDQRFAKANLQLKATAAMFVKNGGVVRQFCAIETEDLEKLRHYFDRSDPTKLQQEAYYVLAMQFGLRGREWFRKLTTESFIRCTVDGKRALKLTPMETKNVRGSLETKTAEDRKQSLLVETGASWCPYECIDLYLEKIEESKRKEGVESSVVFLRPRVRGLQQSWYFAKQVVGVNTLGNMMRSLSQAAGLSKLYTGHCVRVTVTTELKDAGVSLHDIGTITGHKSESATNRYIRRNKKRDSEMAGLSHTISSIGQKRNVSTELPSSEGVVASDSDGVAVVPATTQVAERPQAVEEQPAHGLGLQTLASAISGTFNNCEFHVHISTK